jgi:hypothetical protein
MTMILKIYSNNLLFAFNMYVKDDGMFRTITKLVL